MVGDFDWLSRTSSSPFWGEIWRIELIIDHSDTSVACGAFCDNFVANHFDKDFIHIIPALLPARSPVDLFVLETTLD